MIYRQNAVDDRQREETPEEWWARIRHDRREAFVSHIASLAFVAAIAGELLMLYR